MVKQEDGTLLSSPFHVRFGKLKVLRSSNKQVCNLGILSLLGSNTHKRGTCGHEYEVGISG
jgi:phosphatidate phosphatase PAH1